MQDPRFDKLADVLVNYSTRLKRNETILIEAFDVPDEMTVALLRAARKAGAIPFTQIHHGRVTRELALLANERQLNLTAIHELARMKRMDAYIALRGSNNITELSDVPAEQMKLVAKKMRPVIDQRVKALQNSVGEAEKGMESLAARDRLAASMGQRVDQLSKQMQALNVNAMPTPAAMSRIVNG